MKNIPSNTDIQNEFKKLKEKINKQFKEEVLKLQDELTIMTPVQTGHLRDSWQNPEKIGQGTYVLVNTALYAHKVLIQGMPKGQLPQGILPHIREWKVKLEEK